MGEELLQKRDYLAWQNVVLLVFNAFLLAAVVVSIVTAPLIPEVDPMDPASVGEVFTPGVLLFMLLVQDSVMIWLVWHNVVRRRVLTPTEMGISREQLADSSRMAVLTLAGMAIGGLMFLAAIGIEALQSSVGFSQDVDPIIGPQQGDPWSYVVWVIIGSVIAPVTEEFIFRGYGFYAFERRYGLWTGVVVTAFAFALVHTSIYALLPIFVAGVVLALTFHRTRSLVPCIVAHATYNFVIVTLYFLGWVG